MFGSKLTSHCFHTRKNEKPPETKKIYNRIYEVRFNKLFSNLFIKHEHLKEMNGM